MYDLVFIGGGVRSIGVITAVPELLAHRLAVIESGLTLGPGKLVSYGIRSNSDGRDFLSWIDKTGPFGAVLEEKDVKPIIVKAGNVYLPDLQPVLARAGVAVRDAIGEENALTNATVLRLEYVSGRRPHFRSELHDGRVILSRVVALGIGICENPHPDLSPWRSKCLLSSELLSLQTRARARRAMGPLAGKQVCVVGGSHSAFAALRLCLDLLREEGGTAADARFTLAHRSPIRLFYPDVATAERRAREELARSITPQTDVCQKTGNVFRYSGLRHEARSLYLGIRNGDERSCRLVQSPSIDLLRTLLKESDVIIQATGYDSRRVPLFIDGRPIWHGDERGVVAREADGRIRLSTEGSSYPVLPLYAAGLVPNPTSDAEGRMESMYSTIGRALLRAVAGKAAAA